MRKNLGGRLVKRIIAMALAAVLTFSTISSSVYAAEAPVATQEVQEAKAPAQATEAPVQTSTASEVKEALKDAVEGEIEAGLTAIAVGTTDIKEKKVIAEIVGDEVKAINDEVDANGNLKDADKIIDKAESQIDKSGDLKIVDEELQNAEDAQAEAEGQQDVAQDAQTDAAAAATAAAVAPNSGAALAEVGAADAAADTAEGAAGEAQNQEDLALTAYEAAKVAYEAAKKIADDAMTAALAKVAEGAADADEAVVHATDAYNSAKELEVKYDAAALEAKQDWESKSEELGVAQDDLTVKLDALKAAKGESKEATEAAKEAQDAVKKAQDAANKKLDNLEDAKEALDIAKAALAKAQKAVDDAWSNIGSAYSDLKEADEALKSAKEALKAANELVDTTSDEVEKMEEDNDIAYAQNVAAVSQRFTGLTQGTPEYEALEKEMNELVLSNTLKSAGITATGFVWQKTDGNELYCEVSLADGTKTYYVYGKENDVIKFFELDITTTDEWNAVNSNGTKVAVVVDTTTGSPVYKSVIIDGVTYQVLSEDISEEVVVGTETKYYKDEKEIDVSGLTIKSDSKGLFYSTKGNKKVYITKKEFPVYETQTTTNYYYVVNVNQTVTVYEYTDFWGNKKTVEDSSKVFEFNGKYYWQYGKHVWDSIEVNKTETIVKIPTNVTLSGFASTPVTTYNKEDVAFTESNTTSYVTLVSKYTDAVNAKKAAEADVKVKAEAKKDAVETFVQAQIAVGNAWNQLFIAFDKQEKLASKIDIRKLNDNIKKAQTEYDRASKVLEVKKLEKAAADKAKREADAKVVAANLATEKAFNKIYGFTYTHHGMQVGLYYQERDLKRAYELAQKKANVVSKLVEETLEAKSAAESAAGLFDKLVLDGAKTEELLAAAKKVKAALTAYEAALAASDAADTAAEAARAAYEAALASYNAILAKERANQPVVDGDGIDEAAIVRVATVTAPAQLPTVQVTAIDEAPVALTAQPTTTRRARTVATTDTTEIEEEATPEVAQPEVVEEADTNTAKVDADTTEIADEETALASTMEENGFAWWWILILIAVVTGGGFAGYRYYKGKKVIEE